jgi:hypothetical protein
MSDGIPGEWIAADDYRDRVRRAGRNRQRGRQNHANVDRERLV